MTIILLITFLLSFFPLFFYHFQPKVVGFVSALILFGVFLFFTAFMHPILEGKNIVQETEWVPSLKINLRFHLDGLSLFFALLISLFGSLILLYSTVYMHGKAKVNRFLFYLLLFTASMLGVVLSDNVFLLYVFWELTSVSSYLLISFDNNKKKSRDAGMQALLVTNAGGLALFAGLFLLGNTAGSFNLSVILQSDISFLGSYTEPIILLILLGCFAKSAQFPFHFWLPNAMAAPTPVSAFLHSATMVKAGIFLAMRLNPLLNGVGLWHYSLLLAGGITMIIGAWKALQENDLKAILAAITISTLGLLMASIGVGSVIALQGALIYLFVHALYKGGLFLVVGNIDSQAKTRDLNSLSGLFRSMPYTGIAAILACLSMAGLPPLLGFIGKEKLYLALLEGDWKDYLFLTVFLFCSAIYFMLSVRLSYDVFFGKAKSLSKIKESAFFMWFPPLILGLLGILFGLLGVYVEPFFYEVCNAIIGTKDNVKVDLSLWHGFNKQFLMSILTWLIGVLVYIYRNRLKKVANLFNFLSFEKGYMFTLQKVGTIASSVTLFFQNGFLTRYLKVIFCVLIILLFWVYLEGSLLPDALAFDKEIPLLEVYDFFPMLLIFIGTVFIIKSSSRLRILVCLSLVGYGIAFFYAIFSAPDVSMTQFLVETITLVIFTIILNRMPKNATFPLEARKLLIAAVSVLFGIMMTLVLFSLQQYTPDPALKNFFLRNSAPNGHGENVVNVMLVDFRAFDTFGEIVVLCMTAIGVVALIHLKQKEDKL
ncbi:hydrogen gas-evolving membrane-bound hydrogenase subunit E [Olivibacter domesticus]|uniref:Multicomponent Na+:H+ antiporter subunit A n=1 Tax=Olivibacter domesticus TaxID=407022 RepID=A0A1H7PUI0_OLID1|nr:hydrogen gas-evolving membrane-bound hydrogenase subunit E [Olivibacter domesticus]SEL39551.1 multicomponent Na+:H+ antiporter subunit A [Olivibacter domesticus]